MSSESPFILTLKFDEQTFEKLNELRKQHFPPKRNVVPAHVTLFHDLPAGKESVLRQTLTEVCLATAVLPLGFPKLRSLGKGVAVEVVCPEWIELRERLSNVWRGFLGAQDSRVIKPHVTIQNKVTPDEARALYDNLSKTWQPFDGRGEGLLLWRYLGGPWELTNEFLFTQAGELTADERR